MIEFSFSVHLPRFSDGSRLYCLQRKTALGIECVLIVCFDPNTPAFFELFSCSFIRFLKVHFLHFRVKFVRHTEPADTIGSIRLETWRIFHPVVTTCIIASSRVGHSSMSIGKSTYHTHDEMDSLQSCRYTVLFNWENSLRCFIKRMHSSYSVSDHNSYYKTRIHRCRIHFSLLHFCACGLCLHLLCW